VTRGIPRGADDGYCCGAGVYSWFTGGNVRYGLDSSGITESVEGCDEGAWNWELEVTGRRLSDVGNVVSEQTTGHAPGSVPRVHQRSHRMGVVRLSMNVTSVPYVSHKAYKSKHGLPVSPQRQRRQIKFWQLAFWRCVVPRRWGRALRNARRTGRRRPDVGRVHVNCVHSFWGSPLSWLDADGPSALYDGFSEESGGVRIMKPTSRCP